MSSFRLAINNFKYNMKEYGLFLGAVIFSVVIYYNFTALEYNPEVMKTESFVEKATVGATIASTFLLVFVIFFIWFSNSFFFNNRKKEIGIYMFLGIDNRRIALVFALESLMQGLVSLGAGLVLGFIFARLFMMALAKVVLLDVTIDYFFSFKSLQKTAWVYLSIFFLLSIKNYFNISHSKLIDLFNYSRKEEKPPKAGLIKAVLAVGMIGTAYTLCLIPNYLKENERFYWGSQTVMILIIIGTMLLFSSIFPAILQKLSQNKSFLYRGINLITVSMLSFRVRHIYRALGVIALMVAASMVALSTSLSLRYYMDEKYHTETPYSFTYINEVDDQGLQQQVREMIAQYGNEILLEEHAQILYEQNVEFSNDNKRDTVLITYDDFARIVSDLAVDQDIDWVHQFSPAPGEVIYVEKPSVVLGMSSKENQKIEIDGKQLEINKILKTPLLGSGIPFICLVVDQSDYNELASKLEKFEFYGIIVDNQAETWNLTMDLRSISPLSQSLYSYAEKYADNYRYIGIFYFLGIFLWFIFTLSTGSILYFKIISDSILDRKKYEILSKIGMRNSEIKKSIYQQTAVYYILPYIVGVCHSIIATHVLSELMIFDVTIPVLVSVLIFTVMLAVFYWLTARQYYHLIKGALCDNPF